MTKEEYDKRVEERLAKYLDACQKNADRNGRVDVKKVVIAVWGLKDGKYKEGSWNKTFQALDELVKRQKLRKRERQYYIAPCESSAPERANPTPQAEDGVHNPLHPSTQDDTQALPSTSISSNGQDIAGVDEQSSPPQEGRESASMDSDESKDAERAQLPIYGLASTFRPERVIRVSEIPKQLMGYIDWELFEGAGELTKKVADVGRRAAELIAAGKYDDVDKLLAPIKAELREAHTLWWQGGDKADDFDAAVELLCKVMLAKAVAFFAKEGEAYLAVLATKMWRDVLEGYISADQGLRILKGGENIIPDLLPRIYDLSDPAGVARSLRLFRVNLPRI
jgi:hypothetical protein